MLQATSTAYLLVAAASILALASAIQPGVSSGFSRPWRDEQPPTVQAIHGEHFIEWNLHKLPNPNSTDNLVFETVHSLLQHWPNTRMRNGHNIVPGIIPKGTLLFHGTDIEELPPGPDWVATDPEHSYLFCRNILKPSQHGCWHLTLMTIRHLKVVYFDGNSAAKLPYGTLDTQDLIAWGKSGDDDIVSEDFTRIQDLCKWGKDFGVDGFVRMEMDFEMMLCDFTSGVRASFANLHSGWNRERMIPEFNLFEVVNSGTWHNNFPGETRIRLDLSGLVSFYDTHLVPSLVPIRADQERWDHRVANVSSEDLSAVKSRLEENLTRPAGASSGIDWAALVQVIVDRYARRLELTRYLLNSSRSDPARILDLVKKAQTQLRIMLTPYIPFSAAPPSETNKTELEWTTPVYELCSTTHTHSMETRFECLTESEKTLLRAVRGTSREICRTVTKMWATGINTGIDPLLNTKEFLDIAEVALLRDTWAEELDHLMAWLDWNVWVKCNDECAPEEMCYLPTWPIGFPPVKWGRIPGRRPPALPGPDLLGLEQLTSVDLRSILMERLANETVNMMKPEPGEWIRPQPKCTRRIEPYEYLIGQSRRTRP